MKNDIGLELLAKYLANECSNSEKQVVLNWIESDPVNHDEFIYMKSLWNASGDKSLNWDVEKAWNKFAVNSGIKKIQAAQKINEKTTSKFFSIGKLVPAFSIILILSAAVLYFSMFQANQLPVKKLTAVSALHTIKTEKGQRVSFRLSDGSEVFLNSASSIQFTSNFSNGKREIFLDGEAYFKVVHKENEPFIVYFKGGIAEDIGTEFNVKAWGSDKIASIAVASGEVAVKTIENSKTVHLREGQITMIPENGLPTQPLTTRVSRITGWLNGGLYLDNSELKDVFKYLDRSYNLSCSISDSSLLSLHLSAVFGAESHDDIAKILSLALNFNYKKLNDKIYFYPAKNFYSKKKALKNVQDFN